MITLSVITLSGFHCSSLNKKEPFKILFKSNFQANLKPGPGRCATLGRIKTLEMTECQKQKIINETNNLGRGTNVSLFV
jgi:hypothetical protein